MSQFATRERFVKVYSRHHPTLDYTIVDEPSSHDNSNVQYFKNRDVETLYEAFARGHVVGWSKGWLKGQEKSKGEGEWNC